MRQLYPGGSSLCLMMLKQLEKDSGEKTKGAALGGRGVNVFRLTEGHIPGDTSFMCILLGSGQWEQWHVAGGLLQREEGQGHGCWKQWEIQVEQTLERCGVLPFGVFLSFLTCERGQELMGLPIASVLCSKLLFSNPSQFFCTALMRSRTEKFHLAEGLDSFYLCVSCFNQQESCSAIPGCLSVL